MGKESEKVIQVARVFIEQGWCKRTPARDTHRHPTHLYGEKVSAVSLSGAVKLALASLRLKNKPRTERQVLEKLVSQITQNPDWVESRYDAYDALDAFNDEVAKTKRDVLNVVYAVLGEV
jgi:hypothetical protein